MDILPLRKTKKTNKYSNLRFFFLATLLFIRLISLTIQYLSLSPSVLQTASRLWLCRFWPPAVRERRAVWFEPPPETLEIRVTPAPGSISVSSTPVVSPSTPSLRASFSHHQGAMFTHWSASFKSCLWSLSSMSKSQQPKMSFRVRVIMMLLGVCKDIKRKHKHV